MGLLGASCAQPQLTSRQEMIFGTVIELALPISEDPQIADRIFARLREIDEKMSVQKAHSEINRVSDLAAKTPVEVSSETFTVLERALKMAKISGGAFDPSIGPIVNLWNVTGESPHVPSESEIASALPLVDWRMIETDEGRKTVFLKLAGMRLDFGGIAKGYAADEAARIARESGVKSALLNMGNSSVYLFGAKPDGQKWRIGIQNPVPGRDFQVDRGRYFAILSVSDAVIQTSGPYERFFVRDGVRYHHIMNPKTGRPVENDLLQVTLIVPTSLDLPDGLSTSCFIKGLEEGLKLIESLPDVAAIFVTVDKKVYLSSAVGERFRLTDPNFTVIEPHAGDSAIVR